MQCPTSWAALFTHIYYAPHPRAPIYPPPAAPTTIESMIYDTTSIRWVNRWKKTPKTGGFAISNTLQPTLRPTKRFLNTQREIFGRLIQCRTGHAYTGEFRRRFFPDKVQDCPCGEEYQSREHILAHCTKFDIHRNHLHKISRDVFLPTILGTEEGIQALTTFLQESGAFTMLGRPLDERAPPDFDTEPEVPETDDDPET
ncbi:hypothetical protein GALMADRAFT_138268 [Galerina marginata CBS 339.88]|uniref:Uncharacterized protein n=1 Tax=Galerina marginata (strain CBS 339.88) TaxID=685588 RepID=A0A067TGM5_GALM3|nr:hypothetical protein GALMADRAFT_138268 [Galerina marginata CBS 339.88]